MQGAVHIDFVGGDGVGDGAGDRGEGTLVEDEIDVFGGLLHVLEISEVAFSQFEGRILEEVGDIFPFAGGEVIEYADKMALCEKAFGDIGADKAGATGDEEFIHEVYY